MGRGIIWFIIFFITGSFPNEKKEIFGVLKTVSYSSKRIVMEIFVQNNSNSAIYLDSNLIPYKFQILKSMEYGGEDPDISPGVKVYSGEGVDKEKWHSLFKNRMVEIKPSQNHLFMISKKHNFGPLDGTARVQVKFDYYIKGAGGGSIAVSKDTVFYKE